MEAADLRQAGVTLQTLVWRDGMSGWTPARDVPEVAAMLAPEPAAPSMQQPYAPQQTQQWSPTGQPGGVVAYQTPGSATGAPTVTNGMAITSMVLGIVGLCTLGCYLFGCIVAIVGVIFGHIARGQIRRTQAGGAGMALAGLICGYIAIGITLLLVVGGIVLFAMMPQPTMTPAPVMVPTAPTSPNFPTTVPTRPAPARPW